MKVPEVTIERVSIRMIGDYSGMVKMKNILK
jgi:hypothetical protein